LHRRAKEYFEQGLAKSTDKNEQLVFQKEIDEIFKIQKKYKEEFLASMEIPTTVPLEDGFRVPIKEDSKVIVQDEQPKISDRPKAYEDFFRPKFHEKYTFDFLNLKDIDGRPISREGTGQSSEQAETSMGKVKFLLERPTEEAKKSPPARMRSILKKKNQPSSSTRPVIEPLGSDNETRTPNPELPNQSSKMAYDELD